MRALAPHNQQLLDFIKQYQPIGRARLFASFDGAGESDSTFSKRLQHLKDQGWLVRTGWSARSVWSLNPEARPLHTGARASADAGTPWRKLGSLKRVPCGDDSARLAPLTRISKMQGLYQPPAAQARRPGSDDHTRLPSLRQGRRVPFVAGYIPL